MSEHDHDHDHNHGHDHDHSHDHAHDHAHDEHGGASQADADLDADELESGADDDDSGESAEPSRKKLELAVSVTDSGPCRKHLKVVIPRDDIDRCRQEELEYFSKSAAIPGFRAGRVPRALIEKRFKKDIADRLKQRLLMQSLEQVGQDHELDAIGDPEFDFETIEIPEEGDFEYEFHVEVRPEFDLPNYSGLTLPRPVRDITDVEVDAFIQDFLGQYAQLAPSDEPAAAGDFVVVNLRSRLGDRELLRRDNLQIHIRPTLRFQDAEVSGFDALMIGATTGDTKSTTAKISMETDQIELRGEAAQVDFEVTDVRRLQMPELTPDFLQQIGFESKEMLREQALATLKRQLEHEQRQVARAEVLKSITESANWDLPDSMVSKQVENARRRDWLEMSQAGYTDEQMRARENEMLKERLSRTKQALKEHFVLDRIADEEKLTVTPDDIEQEIRYMAMQRGENPRKVRAKLEKSGMIENLDAQVREQLAIDLVVSRSTFKDVPVTKQLNNTVEALSLSLCAAVSAVTPAVVATDAE